MGTERPGRRGRDERKHWSRRCSASQHRRGDTEGEEDHLSLPSALMLLLLLLHGRSHFLIDAPSSGSHHFPPTSPHLIVDRLLPLSRSVLLLPPLLSSPLLLSSSPLLSPPPSTPFPPPLSHSFPCPHDSAIRLSVLDASVGVVGGVGVSCPPRLCRQLRLRLRRLRLRRRLLLQLRLQLLQWQSDTPDTHYLGASMTSHTRGCSRPSPPLLSLLAAVSGCRLCVVLEQGW